MGVVLHRHSLSLPEHITNSNDIRCWHFSDVSGLAMSAHRGKADLVTTPAQVRNWTQTRLSAPPSRTLKSGPCAPRNVERRWLPCGWRLVECAIRTCNRSLTKKRALSLQVRDPHDRDHVPIVVRLLFCVLVAGPDEVLLGRKGLSFLLNPQLPFGDMADHGIHHRGTNCLRCRLHDDIAHRDGLKTGDDGWCLAIVSAHHHTWPRRLILVARGLSGGWLHHGRRSRCQPDSQC